MGEGPCNNQVGYSGKYDTTGVTRGMPTSVTDLEHHDPPPEGMGGG